MNLKLKSLGVALLYCILFKLSFGLGGFFVDAIPLNLYWYALGTLGTVSILITTWVFLKIEKKTFKDIGLTWEAKTFSRSAIGFAIGIGITCLMLIAMILLTDINISLAENYSIPTFLIYALAFIPLALMEEIAFRSYPFLKLNKTVGLRATQIFMAVLFALYHVGEGSLLNVFIGPGVWGLVYGISAVYSKGIAVPTGLHFGANFILASIGDKKGIDPIFTLNYLQEATPEMVVHSNQIGIAVQVILLIAAVIATELYLKKKFRRQSEIDDSAPFLK